MPPAASIVSILYRYYKKEELSGEELRLLEKWLSRSFKNQQLFDELSNSKAWEAMLDELREKDSDATWKLIRERIGEEHKALSIYSRTWARAAVVGGILLLAAAGWYYWKTDKLPVQQQVIADAPQEVPAIMPGNGQVQLRLSDGSLLTLDSIQRQPITENGKNLASLEQGALKYAAAGQFTEHHQLITPIGRMAVVALSDGTKVWLNAGSEMDYPVFFGEKERLVSLQGEAYFEVAKNGRPFFVQTSRGKVEVLGTHFNVNDYADEPVMQVALAEGKVRVSSAGMSAELKPGEVAVVDIGGKIQSRAADVNALIAWKDNVFRFRQAGYEEIFRQLARWYPVELGFNGNTNARFSGILPRDRSLPELLKILEKGGEAHFSWQNGKLYIAP